MANLTEQDISRLADNELSSDDRNGSCLDDCVKKLQRDPALREKWSRYHLIREVIQNDYCCPPAAESGTRIADRVRDAIAKEPAILSVASQPVSTEVAGLAADDLESDRSATPSADPSVVDLAERASAQKHNRRGWFSRPRNLAGLAVAATVAGVSVLTLNVLQSDNDLPSPAGSGQVALQGSTPIQTAGQIIPVDQQNGRIAFVGNQGTFWVGQNNNEIEKKVAARLNRYLSQHIEAAPSSAMPGIINYSRLAGYDTREQQR